MDRGFLILTGLMAPTLALSCGLDWTLPTNHFDSVEEHGYVSYWEKIGDVDLGDGLTVPVNINFNSHRATDSPTLGKGWMVALLESHVEPLDENSVKVVMPDGWNFYFHRSGTPETWTGNAGWMGETNGAVFTISAPCGWRIKFDGGRIQEIEGDNSRTLTFKYNGNSAVEVDVEGRSIVRVEGEPDGAARDIVVGADKITVAQARRPRIQSMRKQRLVTGFDLSLNQLLWADGRKESFAFGTDKDINPTLDITHTDGSGRSFTWDAATGQIKTEGPWTYHLRQVAGRIRFDRILGPGETESFEDDPQKGVTVEKSLTGNDVATYRFASGPLTGRIRKVEERNKKVVTTLYAASYFPSGLLMREMFYPNRVRVYSETRKLLRETIGDEVVYQQDFDDQGRLIHLLDPSKGIEMKRTYDAQGAQVTQVFRKGILFYTEAIDRNNNLISFNEGDR
jgi:YD repeat-containing protein